MNLFSFLISTGFNLLQAPFSGDGRGESSFGDNSVSGSATSESWFPFSILRNTPACTTIEFKLGENHLKLTSLPRGFCSNCCQAKLSRDVKFTLFNKGRPKKGSPIVPYLKAGAARKAGVDPDLDTVIFVHGFSEASPGESGRAIINAYLARPEDFNIILLDWSELSPFPWYSTAVKNVRIVGRVLAKFLEVFEDSGEIPLEKVHLIGFSLGSHVSSMAGKKIKDGMRLRRITALDPAFPEFSVRDATKRLANTDAEYIDVIHTDSGVFGFPIPVGHADFYPNGGRALQPGCQPSYLAQRRIIDQVLACSHVRAWRLYAESVNSPKSFPSTQCQLWRGPNKKCNFTNDAYMGFENRNSSGQFYLLTGFSTPFGLTESQQR